MKSLIISLLMIVGISNVFGSTCTSISRTANSANSVLTSTKYNLDLSTVYSAVNAFDGGCTTAGTLEADALNATDFRTVLAAPKNGCEVARNGLSGVLIKACDIAINDAWTRTATNTTVAFGCSGCSAETATTTYYVYASDSSTTSSLSAYISSTAPSDRGYNGNDRVLAKFFNDENANVATGIQNWYVTGFGGGPERKIKVITTGSGTYYVKSKSIKVTVIGAGGGGGAAGTGSYAGSGGTSSVFGTISAGGGGGGGIGSNQGVSGGSGSGGDICVGGQRSGHGGGSGGGSLTISGDGGNAAFGMGTGGRGGFYQNNGFSGEGYGAGGGAGGFNAVTNGGSGGGGGAGCISLIDNPATSYSYTIGAGGNAGHGAYNGATGNYGVIVIEEYY